MFLLKSKKIHVRQNLPFFSGIQILIISTKLISEEI